ncbi:MAG: response regulator transcription factor [Verrucomicrobiota bacterium]
MKAELPQEAVSQAGISNKHRVFIVDDHPIVQQALGDMLNHEADLEVCGSTQNARAALDQIEKLRPDLVILDLVLNGANGIDLLKDIRVRYPKQLVLMLSMHDEAIYAFRACRAGAAGYIMKAEATEKLLVAVRQILEGGLYLSDRMQKRVLDRMHARTTEEQAHPLDQLSDREIEVLRLLGHGRSTREIAGQLHLSVKTIESHRAHLKEKLNLKTGTELVQYAVRLQEDGFGPTADGAAPTASGASPDDRSPCAAPTA